MKREKRWPLLAVGVVAIGGGILGGCGSCGSKSGEGGAGSASAAVSAPSASASVSPAKVAIRGSGVPGAIFRAVRNVELKPEQKASLEKISNDQRDAEKAARGEGDNKKNETKEIHAALAAGVRAGKLDTAKLDGLESELESAVKARHDRELDVLNKVHAVLDPAQRSAIAANVRAQEDRRFARMRLASVGSADKGDAGTKGAADGGRSPFSVNLGRFRLERYTKDLDLDAEQRKKVDALYPKEDPKLQEELREEAKKRSDALLAAFEKEPFDAKKVDGENPPKKRPGPSAETARFVGQLIPILKPDQREKLAAHLEKDHGGGRGDDPRRHRPDRDRDRDRDHGHGGEDEDDTE